MCGPSRSTGAAERKVSFMITLISIAAGLIAVLVASRDDGAITRRPYAKLYGGAPGARDEKAQAS